MALDKHYFSQAAFEEINNSIFRRGHVALGLSSAISSSGMAFDFNWFKKNIMSAKTSYDEKELELLFHLASNPKPLHAVEVIILTLTFAIPLMGDMMALYVGKAFGKRKFCPAVSPKKTLEGSLGGLAGSVLAAVIIYLMSLWLCNEATRSYLPAWWMYPLLGLAGGQVFSNFLFGQIDQLAICFVTEPVWISFAASAAITAAISGVIHFFAFRKIRDLKLSDIQK